MSWRVTLPGTWPWLSKLRTALILLLLLLVVCVAFRGVLLQPGLVLPFNDGSIETALSPTFRLPDIIPRFWDNQFFFGQGNGVLCPTTTQWLEIVFFGPHTYRREGTMLGVWCIGVACYWALRQFRRSRSAALFAALLLMLCGWTLTSASVGLLNRGTSIAFSALSLGVLERNRNHGRMIGYVVAGGLLGLAVSDVPDVGALLALCCGTYFLCVHLPHLIKHRSPLSALMAFAIYVLSSAAIAFPTLQSMIPLTKTSGTIASATVDDDAEFGWATQWSLPPAETWSLFAIDYHGTSIRSASTPYWGTMGRSPGWQRAGEGYANFRLQGYAIGVVPVILLTILYVYLASFRDSGLLEKSSLRTVLTFTGIAIASLLLSWGKHFPLYACFYNLPFMSSMRNPEKWLGPFSLCVAVCVAHAVDLILAMGSRGDPGMNRKILVRSGMILAAVPIIAVVLLAASNPTSFTERLRDLGLDNRRIEAAWSHTQRANLQAIIVAAAGFGLLWCTVARRKTSLQNSKLVVGLMGCLMVAELVEAATPYVQGYSYAYVLAPTTLTSKLNDVRDQGRLKLSPPRHPVLNHWRLTHLSFHGYDLFDPATVRRLPADYDLLFRESGMDVTRLWELGSVRFFLVPLETVHQLTALRPSRGEFVVREELPANSWDPVLVGRDEKVCLVEFTAAMPFFDFVTAHTAFDTRSVDEKEVLRQLNRPEFDPKKHVFLDCPRDNDVSIPDTTQTPASPATVEIEVNKPSLAQVAVDTDSPGILVRSTKYDSDWHAKVDGQPTAAGLLRANGFFQGVFVPQGHHTVTFEYRPSRVPLVVYALARAILVVCILGYMASGRSRKSVVAGTHNGEREGAA